MVLDMEVADPQSFARRYDATLVPVIFRPWAQELIRRASPQDGEHVLDLGCGTGIVTIEVSQSGVSPASVTGVDHSADMLEVARKTAADLGVTADWIEADASQLPFPDHRFDLAFCQQALQFFPDRPAALRELRRVLVPGGRVAACVQCDLSENPLLRSQAEALDKHVGTEAGRAVRAICSLSDPNELRALFAVAQFEDITVEKVTLELHHPDGRAFAAGAMGGMHTGDKLGALGDAGRDKCIDDFLEGLGDHYSGGALRFPHVSLVVLARA
jgi:ubiquinone/menaquinone biosynthesis C-methylase UbiE